MILSQELTMELNLKKSTNNDFISEISVAQSYQMQRQTYMQENSGISEKFQILLEI